MDSLKIHQLEIPLELSMSGPVLSANDPQFESLAWVINSAVADDTSTLTECIEKGMPFYKDGLYLSRQEADQDIKELQNKWYELTGTDAGDDVYIAGTTFTRDDFLIPRKVLQVLIAELIKLRQQPLPPATWLFRPHPYYEKPNYFEAEHMKELDAQANLLDDLDKVAVTLEEHATVSAKRQFLLIELEAAGLLTDTSWKDKKMWLSNLKLKTLSTYYDATLHIIAYFHSRERKNFFSDSPVPESILNCYISLDWFRNGNSNTPCNFNSYAWLGECEYLLQQSNNTTGGTGEILVREEGEWFQITWRKDNGTTPTLLSAKVLA